MRGWSRRDRTADFLDVGEALLPTELWINDRGTGHAVPRRRCALDHQALRSQVIATARIARVEGMGKLRRLSRFWRPALWPLSYARVAGEIGIEPMASCASDRRSTHG